VLRRQSSFFSRRRQLIRHLIITVVWWSACSSAQIQAQAISIQDRAEPATAAPIKPNFLLVMVDDLGYSDLGAFGGEIETPTIDSLAMNGVRMNAFYTAPTCSPTRAALLSGTDPHLAGLGNMAELMSENQRGLPGYEGYLNDRVVSVASLLRDAGYFTAMTGKWHLGLEQSQSPAARGFSRSFALLHGGAGHFDDTGLLPATPKAIYREDGALASWPSGQYSSDVYTSKLIDYMRENEGPRKPFFAYLAFSAVHWPLQAPDALIRHYRGRYDKGWDVLRRQRMEGLIRTGLLPASFDTAPPPGYLAWDTLDAVERVREARKMEVFAAMVHSIDQNMQRLLAYLEQSGQLDNTVIIFLSDNGAEGTPLEHSPMLDGWIDKFDNSPENMGSADSYIFYGPSWAHATTAPGKHYKSHVFEGGIHVPAFIWRKGMTETGAIASAPATVMDISPTFLELAGVTYPERYRGRLVEKLRGASLVPLMIEPTSLVHGKDDVFAVELFGRRAIRQGKWKLCLTPPPFGKGDWELYDIEQDLGETRDLAASHPDVVERLKTEWQQYAEDVGVILPVGPSGY
jgi:arylsulfatase A-like enzyme